MIDASARGEIAIAAAAVVVNRADAYAAERARIAGIPVRTVVWNRSTETRAAYDARLLAEVEVTEPDVVILLGWMHVLAPSFVARFPELLNIHPAYLPLDPLDDVVVVPDGTRIAAFRGAHAIRDAIANHSRWYGASVHRVTGDVDRGEIIARRAVPLVHDDEREALAALRPVEAETLVDALRRFTPATRSRTKG